MMSQFLYRVKWTSYKDHLSSIPSFLGDHFLNSPLCQLNYIRAPLYKDHLSTETTIPGPFGGLYVQVNTGEVKDFLPVNLVGWVNCIPLS